jgi:hypothetical protein
MVSKKCSLGEHKTQRNVLSFDILEQYNKDGDEFLYQIVTGDEI